MRIASESTWPATAAAWAVAACVSVAVFILSVIDGRVMQATLSLFAAVLFSACVFMALSIGSRLEAADGMVTEVRCLRLKRPGIEKHGEEIRPKAKMPKG